VFQRRFENGEIIWKLKKNSEIEEIEHKFKEDLTDSGDKSMGGVFNFKKRLGEETNHKAMIHEARDALKGREHAKDAVNRMDIGALYEKNREKDDNEIAREIDMIYTQSMMQNPKEKKAVFEYHKKMTNAGTIKRNSMVQYQMDRLSDMFRSKSYISVAGQPGVIDMGKNPPINQFNSEGIIVSKPPILDKIAEEPENNDNLYFHPIEPDSGELPEDFKPKFQVLNSRKDSDKF